MVPAARKLPKEEQCQLPADPSMQTPAGSLSQPPALSPAEPSEDSPTAPLPQQVTAAAAAATHLASVADPKPESVHAGGPVYAEQLVVEAVYVAAMLVDHDPHIHEELIISLATGLKHAIGNLMLHARVTAEVAGLQLDTASVTVHTCRVVRPKTVTCT